MTAAEAVEPRQGRKQTGAAGTSKAADVTINMGLVEADLTSAFLARSYKAFKAQLEQNHEAELRDVELRTLKRLVQGIRRQLAEADTENEYPPLDLS